MQLALPELAMIACARAYNFLNKGQNYYWPKATRQTILTPVPDGRH